MPILNAAGRAITTPGTTQSPVWMTYRDVMRRIAKVIQGENDPEILESTRDGIRWALHQFNFAGPWAFKKKQAADLPITEGDRFFALEDSYFHSDMVQLVWKAGTPDAGKEYGVLEWMNWDQFQKLAGQQTNTGVPGVATIHNAFDEGSLQVHSIPDAYTENNFDLRIHQYEQVLIPDSETDVFQLPYPMIEGIVDGGRYRLLLEREPEGGRMGHCLAQFKVQVDQSRTLDRKQNNAPRDGAFRLEIF